MPLLIAEGISEQIGAWVAFAALLFLAGFSLSYYLSRRLVLREVERMKKQLAEATAARAVAEPMQPEKPKAMAAAASASPVEPVKSAPAPKHAPAPLKAETPKPEAPKKEELSEEMLLVIAAAVAAYLGKKVRLRSARLVHPAEANLWAQQGRVYVQASHNLALTHRD